MRASNFHGTNVSGERQRPVVPWSTSGAGPEPSAGEREGATPRKKKQREGATPRKKEDGAGGDGWALVFESTANGQKVPEWHLIGESR